MRIRISMSLCWDSEGQDKYVTGLGFEGQDEYVTEGGGECVTAFVLR